MVAKIAYSPLSEVTVQFLAFDGCPLADAARAALEQALSNCAMSSYEEIDILDPGSPKELRGWGSPTILVNGIDASGQVKGDSVSCRVYPGPNGVPDRRAIVASIEGAIAR